MGKIFKSLFRQIIYAAVTRFYCAVLNAGRSSQEKAVHPSVSPSVKRVHCNKIEARAVQIFIPYERLFSLVFSEEEGLVGAVAA